jgi:uncharacterized protein involved in exopolysaccharide biosynthesis
VRRATTTGPVAERTAVAPQPVWRLRLLWVGVAVFAGLLLVSLVSLVLR